MRAAGFSIAAQALLMAACVTTGSDVPPGAEECRCPSALSGPADENRPVGEPRTGGTVSIRISSEPSTLMSMLTPDPVTSQIVDHDVFEALVALDPSSRDPLPELAESWTEDAASGRYTFYLDPRARWHDGAQVVAADVEFTFERLLDPAGGAVLRSAFLDVDAVTALDEHTVQIQLDRGRPGLVAALASLPILPSHAFGNDLIAGHPLTRAPIGTGPFRFSAWRRGRTIELERNPAWRGTPPRVDRVVYRVVPDQRVSVDLFRGGDLDIVPDSEGGSCPVVKGGRVINYPLPRFEAWIYNTQTPILADRRVRMAIGQLIDRQAMRCSILDCMAQPIEHPFPEQAGVADPAQPLRFNPARARALLEKAGWRDTDGDGVRDRNGIRLSLGMLLPDTGRALRRAVTVVQHDLKRSGVELRVMAVSRSEHAGRLRKHQFDVSVVAFPNAAPFDPRSIFHSSGAINGRNFGQFSDSRTDQILDSLTAEHSPRRQQELATDLAARLREEHPVTFTFRPWRSVLVRNSLRDIRIRDAWIDERTMWIASSPEEQP